MVFDWFKKLKKKKDIEKDIDIEDNIIDQSGEEERIEKEKQEKLEQERIEKEKQEKLEQERVEKEKQEKLEQERIEKEKQEKLERERIEKEKQEKLEQERVEKEKQEKLEQERIEKEKQEKLERERVEKEKQEKLERERVEKEKQEELEQERIEKEKQEKLEQEGQEQQEQDNKKETKKSFFSKIKAGLSKTKDGIFSGMEKVLSTFTKIDEELFEELEETLILSDIGVSTATFIIDEVRQMVRTEKITEVNEIKNVIARVIASILEKDTAKFELKYPSVILIIGVNGVGKTTTIGKLANNYKSQGKNVLLVAGDTFRAAAIDQLQVWGDRSDIPVIKHQENSDPAAVVYDGIQAGKARNSDIIICDTAGRLHNKKNLMEELKKISKVIKKERPDANIETFLVLDATTGQNALQQAKLFSEVADVTGLILTKLDGTAKGGVTIAIKNEMNIPVRFIGVGEGIEDLREFDAKEFSKALFE